MRFKDFYQHPPTESCFLPMDAITVVSPMMVENQATLSSNLFDSHELHDDVSVC